MGRATLTVKGYKTLVIYCQHRQSTRKTIGSNSIEVYIFGK